MNIEIELEKRMNIHNKFKILNHNSNSSLLELDPWID